MARRLKELWSKKIMAFDINSSSFFSAMTISAVVLTTFCFNPSSAAEMKTKKPYYGKHIGDFGAPGTHKLAGSVYAVDSHRFFIYKQNYAGDAPRAYFWIGATNHPDRSGQPIRWPNSGPAYFSPVNETERLLRAFAKENVIVEMPSSANISSYTWFSMWCAQFNVSFGHVDIPPNFSPPKPRTLYGILHEPEFNELYGLSSGPITLLDSKTILIEDFHFNGTGLGAGFYVGTGHVAIGSPFTLNNSAIRVRDEYQNRSSEEELNSYSGQDVNLTLPVDVDLMNVDWLSVYSTAKQSHLAFVKIPKDLEESIPPNLNEKAIGYSGKVGLNDMVGTVPILGQNGNFNVSVDPMEKSTKKPIEKTTISTGSNAQKSVSFSASFYTAHLCFMFVFVTNMLI